MLQINYPGSCSPCRKAKSTEANAASTANKAVAAGKQLKAEVLGASCQTLSKRDKAYFASAKFAETLKRVMDRRLASDWREVITLAKKRVDRPRAYDLVDVVIYVDLFEAHYDGFVYSFEEVRDLFKGYRSQALREAKASKGFNKLFYLELAKALETKAEVRSFLKALNRPQVKESIIIK